MFIKSSRISNNTIANLETRDIAVWLHGTSLDNYHLQNLVAFLGLPWRLVVLDGMYDDLANELEKSSSNDSLLTRRRGFIHVVDNDPSLYELPPRSLPIYLLQGRGDRTNTSEFEDTLRQMTMLQAFRQSNVRELLVISDSEEPIPQGLTSIWSAGYRSQLTIVSEPPFINSKLEQWLEDIANINTATIVQQSPEQLIDDVLGRYFETYPEDRNIVRIRDAHGGFRSIDLTEIDDYERPVLDSYSLIEERHLQYLTPQELSEEEFVGFFKNSTNSWRPYAARLPWIKDPNCKNTLQKCLRDLDNSGAEANCIAYITSEAGAGGTTLARALAYELASEGYPVLLAKMFPFVPESLPIVNYLTRASRKHIRQQEEEHNDTGQNISTITSDSGQLDGSKHETPWIIVFDTLHWQNRDAELIKFRNELSKAGRSVCLLVVTGSITELSWLNFDFINKVSELNHSIELEEANDLGQHLNDYLQYYGQARTSTQWRRFHQEHTTRYLEGFAAFWVTLSFWIQGKYDLNESIQSWIYRSFKEEVLDTAVQNAILQIAAMSSERLPLPEGLLPKERGRWPVSELLDDLRSELAGLGLMQVVAHNERYWALLHDILGRLLINALFYDYTMRDKLGFSHATDPEHLRFILLSQVAENSRLNELAYRKIGEDFATHIFKIDPDHGSNSFVHLWREVLDTLDKMPKLLRENSRVFRHHSAISRRRIAKLASSDFAELYDITIVDRVALLRRAIADIDYALKYIDYRMGSETNLNLLNSLAHAYFDLAEAEMENGASEERIAELKIAAHEATRRAYLESPSNSFVIETYVRSLLQAAQDTPKTAMESCVTALGTIYTAMHNNSETSRLPQLAKHADLALQILLEQSPMDVLSRDPTNVVDILVQVWVVLAESRLDDLQVWSLENIPLENQEKALEVLKNPIGRGNLQILRLGYELTCNTQPYEFQQQLEFLEPLYFSEYWMPPQLRLEYAILLYQVDRFKEGDKAFRDLRTLWRTSDHFVHVPERLRWLRARGSKSPRIVNSIVSSIYENRTFAIVKELANVSVPFRPEEHGFSEIRPRLSFRCYISFGHNGPFLRPTTAKPPSV